MRQKAARRAINTQLDKLIARVRNETGLDVIHRISARGVPHLVVTLQGHKASITYFHASRSWKLFAPWPSHGKPQIVRKFKTTCDVVNHLKQVERDYVDR